MKILLCLLFVFLLAWDYPWQNNSFNFIWVLEIWHKQYLRIALWGIKVIVDICAVLWTHVENSQIHILYASQSEIFFFFIISSCFLVILYYEAEPINIFNLMNKDFFWGGGEYPAGSWFKKLILFIKWHKIYTYFHKPYQGMSIASFFFLAVETVGSDHSSKNNH